MQDFYGEGGGEPAPEASEMDEGGETALVPKSMLCGDCKVGETYTFKVAGIYDDEVELELVKGGENKPEMESEDTPDSRMDAMAL